MPTIKSDAAFESWMKNVDAAVLSRYGVSVYDLPDCPFRDWYDDGETPEEASVLAVAYADGDY